MLPLLPQMLCAAAEKLLAHLISIDPQAKSRLVRLQGKQLAFTLQELKLRLVITASSDGLLFNQHNEPVDCAISTDMASLRLLRDPSQLTRLIKADALQIDGDIQVAQQFSYFFEQLDPDWQQQLSGYIGDGLAHKIAFSVKQLQQYIALKVSQLRQHSGELLQDELRLTPVAPEMAKFSNDVSDLSARVELLQQLINRYREC